MQRVLSAREGSDIDRGETINIQRRHAEKEERSTKNGGARSGIVLLYGTRWYVAAAGRGRARRCQR